MSSQSVVGAMRLAVVAGMAFVAACSDQTTNFDEIVRATSTCRECSVESDLLWQSDPDDSNVTPAAFYLERQNGLWAMGGFADEKIVRFDLERGASRRFGERGEGPGEIEDQIHGAALDPSTDTLILAQAHRVEFFSIDGEVEAHRSFRSPVAIGGAFVSLEDGSLVIADSRGMEFPGVAGAYLLHRLSAAGNHISSAIRLAPHQRGGHVWLARGHEPTSVWVSLPIPSGRQLLQWDFEADSLIRRFSIAPDCDWWYDDPRSAAQRETRSGSLTGPPRPSTGLTDFHDDGRVLWLSIGHVDPGYSSVDPEYFAPSQLYDTFLFAVDRESGDVVSGTRFDEFGIAFTNRGNLVLYSEGATGRPRIELRQLHLKSSSRQSKTLEPAL